MIAPHKATVKLHLVCDEDEDKRQPSARPSTASAEEPGVRNILANAIPAFGILLLVIAFLIAFTLSRRKQTNHETNLDRNGRKLVRRLTPTGQIEMLEIEVGLVAQGLNDRAEETSYYCLRTGLNDGDKVLVERYGGRELSRRIASLPR